MNLIFAEPLLLSNLPDIDYHSVSVEVLETVYFTSMYNDAYKQEGQINSKIIL